MKKIIVLGSGMVGSAIAIELSKKFNVTVADLNLQNLERAKRKCTVLNILQIDVTDKKILSETLSGFDLVVCAVPGFLGFRTLQTIIEAKKNVVDISFFPENALELNELAKQHQVTAIVDCGVAPGLDNIILGYYNEFISITDFECLVGGLPEVKKWPFNYKAPFSPIDVIEEYTRPARYVEDGKLITKAALTDCTLHEFEHVGQLESFNSDGLRSLIFTLPHILNMKEKTLRYPGHSEYIRVLKESGFFSEVKISVNGHDISPLQFTSKILFNEWKLGEDEQELTVMRVTVKGIDKSGAQQNIVFEIFDRFDDVTQTSSMARTTGYTACAAVHIFMDGLFSDKGVFPPELIGKHENCFHFVLHYLREKGIQIEKKN